MATLAISASIQNSDYSMGQSASATITTTGDNVDHRIVSIVADTEKEIAIDADIATKGYCFIRHYGETEILGVMFETSGDYLLEIPAGGIALFPLPSGQASVFFRCGETCEVEVFFHEA